MNVTRSWEQVVTSKLGTFTVPMPPARKRELWWLLGSSLLVGVSLLMVGLAKTQNFGELQAMLDRGELLDLNAVTDAEQLLPFLQIYTNEDERTQVAETVWSYLQKHKPLPNVGALARLRLPTPDSRLPTPRFPTPRLKPLFLVRTPAQFYRKFAQWVGIYFAAFLLVHLAWRWRRFRGDASILPALQMLTGLGLTLAVSLKDPLRDTIEFEKFAWGVAVGCCMLLLPLLRLFHFRHFSRWTYTPLLLAFGLFVLLLRLGSGPTGSDARVNLGPFQPVELIKILLVLFMAGYFARKWEWLRDLREKNLLPRFLRWIEIPRVSQALPVMCAVAIALLFFFILKDMGPALVTGFLFLTMFAIARGRWGLALIGVIVLVAGVSIGYHIGKPPTVVDRVSMWLSPWDNNVRGGDQLAHSIWALSTGGLWGSGPGWGDPGMIPAGHTDLVLPAIGEEWGFIGVVTIAVLFAFLVYRTFRIALRAPNEYAMFLCLGLGTLVALEMLLISGGVLGAIPLSGVVSPFLSAGNTAMLSNFLIFALILGVSNQAPATAPSPSRLSSESSRLGTEPRAQASGIPFRKPVWVTGALLTLATLFLVQRAYSYQVLHDQDLLVRDCKVFAEDKVKRPQHNPRLNSLARELTRGPIYDRNGIPLATSTWDELERHRADYEKLGVNIDETCSRLDSRHYPFGGATVHLLGDLRTGERFHATNASLMEHDSNQKLQGFRDYAELAAYVRYRHQPGNALMQSLRARDRSVHASIDIRYQLRAIEILRNRLEKAKRDHGALLVMNAQTGDVLALVSAPLPPSTGHATDDALLDRARYGQYPPGSTFKLVTAIAALRKDPELRKKKFHCAPLGDGRVGTRIPGWRKPIRDDVGDSAHGSLDMMRAITVSCNAYFAQLGTYEVGAQRLHDTAELLDIDAGDAAEIKKMMPFAAYGQGPVLVTPFKMARVAATISDGGTMPQGRWVIDQSNSRNDAPLRIVAPDSAAVLAAAMRSVVTGGTGRRAMAGLDISVAGKTGTAQMDEGMPHSWFAGFAPYDADPASRIAFAVVVEHGGYGAQVAAPTVRELIEAARDLGIIPKAPTPLADARGSALGAPDVVEQPQPTVQRPLNRAATARKRSHKRGNHGRF
jgi:cell division protein FtsW (lipid II flippase)/cell division protein FtsI/penicillin-binding protein 2